MRKLDKGDRIAIWVLVGLGAGTLLLATVAWFDAKTIGAFLSAGSFSLVWFGCALYWYMRRVRLARLPMIEAPAKVLRVWHEGGGESSDKYYVRFRLADGGEKQFDIPIMEWKAINANDAGTLRYKEQGMLKEYIGFEQNKTP